MPSFHGPKWKVDVLTSGTSWSKPIAGIREVLVWGCGGGGGGGGGGNNGSNQYGGSGGAGAPFLGPFRVDVSAVSSVTYLVAGGGAGGAGGNPNGVDGTDGGESYFGSIYFFGGKGGQRGTNVSGGVAQNYTTSPKKFGTPGGADTQAGENSNLASGGVSGGGGGGGGGASYGAGGDGNGSSPGSVGGYGAGGGGGAANLGGGAGGQGIILVMYEEF